MSALIDELKQMAETSVLRGVEAIIVTKLHAALTELEQKVEQGIELLQSLEKRLQTLETKYNSGPALVPAKPLAPSAPTASTTK